MKTWPFGESRMASRIRENDWTATPLGPISRWPERLKTLVEIVLANGFPMALLWGPDLVHIYNDSYGALLGADDSALGRPLRQTSPEFWQSNVPLYERVRAGETVTTADVLFPGGRSGSESPRFTQSCSPVRGSDGIAVAGILVTLVETTAGERAETVRRRAEQAMRASEERLRIANEVGRLAVWDWDLQSDEISWSQEHFHMLGYAVGEITPSHAAWTSRIHPDDRAATEAALALARSGGGGEYVREFRTLHPDGTVRWLSARGQFFYDEKGNAIRMVGAMVDVTERREWEERQSVLVAELQHRTRNLIAVVRSIAQQTMAQTEPSEGFWMQFNERLSALSRVQGLLSQASEERIAIGHLVRLELEAFGAKNFGDRIALDGPEVRLRNSVVQTLALAVHELATNARKHGALATQEGRLKIAWAVDEADGEGRRLRLEWLEHGIAQPAQQGAPKLGYGRELIEKALPYTLGAKTSFKLSRDQLRCTIELPLDSPDGANGDIDGLF